MKMIFVLFYIMCLCICLRADIDATVTPSVVNNRYIFADGEKVDGFVAFVKGFELPINGTIHLNLAPGMRVDGSIIFNGGTINLIDDLYLGKNVFWDGVGFLEGFNREIVVSDFLTIGSGDRVVITSNQMQFRGISRPELRFQLGGQFDLSRPGVDEFTFNNFDIRYDKDAIITTSQDNNLNLIFRNCNLSVGGSNNAHFLNTQVTVEGNTTFIGNSAVEIIIDQFFQVDRSARFNLGSLSLLRIGGLDTGSARSEFILENSILDVSNTVSPNDPIVLGSIAPFQGRFSVVGPSILRSSAGNPLIMPETLQVQFQSGSRLALEAGTKLTVN